MTDYELMLVQTEAFGETDPWYVPFLSNVSAVLMEGMADINWAGFYLLRDGQLVLGPFQGKPACIHIAVGKGVCGTAVSRRQILRVEDVHAFPGHIACDAASRSEIVLPLYRHADAAGTSAETEAGEIFGVLDIDSPSVGRFTAEDEEGLARIAALIGRTVRL